MYSSYVNPPTPHSTCFFTLLLLLPYNFIILLDLPYQYYRTTPYHTLFTLLLPYTPIPTFFLPGLRDPSPLKGIVSRPTRRPESGEAFAAQQMPLATRSSGKRARVVVVRCLFRFCRRTPCARPLAPSASAAVTAQHTMQTVWS